MHLEMHNNQLLGHQAAICMSQVKMSINSHVPPYGESRWHYGDAIYKRCSFVNRKSIGGIETISAADKKQGMGGVPAAQQPMCSKLYNKYNYGPQMTISLLHQQSSGNWNVLLYRESRQFQRYKRHLNANDEAKKWAGNTSAVDERQGTGNIPDPQLLMHSRTCENSYDGLQMASPMLQVQPPVKLRTSGYGEMRRCHGDTVYKTHLTMNDESKKRLTKASVSQNKRSTVLYSPKTVPKAPDKGAQYIDGKKRTEAHYAPWPKERDHINNMTWWKTSRWTKMCQQSQCDICHETINVMQGHIMSNRGPTDVGTSTDMSHRTVKAVQTHAYNDDDWSSSGPKCGTKNDTEQLSEDSDELSEDPSDVRESD
jgi:hypothetical protein